LFRLRSTIIFIGNPLDWSNSFVRKFPVRKWFIEPKSLQEWKIKGIEEKSMYTLFKKSFRIGKTM
jgi:hypothetical protein